MGRPRSFVLNIDSGWGGGKTYFLANLARQLSDSGYLVAEVNAWRDDHADDPLLAVMSAVDARVKPYFAKKAALRTGWEVVRKNGAAIAIAAAKGALVHSAKRLIGAGVAEIEELTDPTVDAAVDEAEDAATTEIARITDRAADRLLATFETTKRSIDAFRGGLTSLLRQLDPAALPLFVLVDELDRCRPPYAITLLERVKHLFDLDNVVFIVATDTAELSHSVGAVYGSSFNSRAYLRRFFDRTYTFDVPDRASFVAARLKAEGPNAAVLSVPSGAEVETFIADGFTAFGLQLRDMEQCLDIVRSIATMWRHPAKIELCVLLPLIIGYHLHIPPSLDPSFTERLKERRTSNWSVKDLNARNSEARTQNYETLFRSFADARTTSLLQNAHRADDSGVSDGIRYASARYWAEIEALQSTNVRFSHSIKSVIGEYPQLVTRAGRIAQLPPRS